MHSRSHSSLDLTPQIFLPVNADWTFVSVTFELGLCMHGHRAEMLNTQSGA